jgi:hypothetical protein
MDRARFARPEEGDRLRERRGRTWAVVGQPYREDCLVRVVVRSGDLVRLVPEHFADDYMLLSDTVEDAGLPGQARSRAANRPPGRRHRALSPLWSEVARVSANASAVQDEVDGR